MEMFQCDYTGGCHPAILDLLKNSNELVQPGYCEDEFCEKAEKEILKTCHLSSSLARVFWVASGTMANLVTIDTALSSNEAVLAADSSHIAAAEAGAIEACGGKILSVNNKFGKISSSQIDEICEDYYSREEVERSHLSRPAAVYISFPTEFGTLYSLDELEKISKSCKKYDLLFYIDGARLAYGLAASNISLAQIAKVADVFYIGGTKCGSLIGEALVVNNSKISKRLLGVLRMRGGLIAKGRLLGCSFLALFENNLYLSIGERAVKQAQVISEAFENAGFPLLVPTMTNQVFPVVDASTLEKLQKKFKLRVLRKTDDEHYLLRLCTSWSTSDKQIQTIVAFLKKI